MEAGTALRAAGQGVRRRSGFPRIIRQHRKRAAQLKDVPTAITRCRCSRTTDAQGACVFRLGRLRVGGRRNKASRTASAPAHADPHRKNDGHGGVPRSPEATGRSGETSTEGQCRLITPAGSGVYAYYPGWIRSVRGGEAVSATPRRFPEQGRKGVQTRSECLDPLCSRRGCPPRARE